MSTTREDQPEAQVAPRREQRRHGEDEDGERVHAGHAVTATLCISSGIGIAA